LCCKTSAKHRLKYKITLLKKSQNTIIFNHKTTKP